MAEETTQTIEKDFDTNLFPSASESKKVGAKMFTVLDEILADKESLGLPSKWAYHYELGKNKHWKSTSKKASLISANLLHTHRQRTVNMLTDNNPTFNAVQIGNVPDDEIIDIYLHTAQHWWHDQEQQAVLEKSIINGETFGCCVEKVIFNPDLEFGMGEIETIVTSPYHFGMYPVKSKDPQKAEAILFFQPMSLRATRRKWPKFANQIQADSAYLSQIGEDNLRQIQSGKPGRMQDWFATISNVVRHMLGNTEDGGKGKEDELLVVECWTKDYTKVKKKVEQEDGSVVETSEPKYTGEIRYIVSCNGGNVVMEDKSNPSISPQLTSDEARKCYLYDKFPVSLTQSITDTINAWGSSDFEQLKALNIEINKTLSEFNLFKDKVARLILLNPKTSGVPNSALSNYPGTARPNNSQESAGIKYVDPPRMPLDLQNALTIYKEFFFLVAGTFELELAQTPGREVVAYKAIAALLERATTMMRGKVRNYMKMVTERGRMFFSHAQNWYDDDRWIAYVKDGENVTQQISGKKLRVPLKLTVVPGSTMPVSHIQRREEAIGLKKQGDIDIEELLKRLDWPDWRNVVQRMKQGPFSNFLQMLGEMGFPQELVQFFQQLQAMDKKEFDQASMRKQMPSFQTIMQQMQGQPDPIQQLELAEKQGEVEKTEVETDKITAEIELIDEKIVTERVKQIVQATGITFDEEKLELERLKILADLEKEKMKGTESYRKKRGQGPFRERGLTSNNIQ